MKSTDAGSKRRRIAPVLLLAALSALAGVLALAPSSAGQDPNTWSGTWVNSAPDGSFWVFSQSGASVGGVWKGNPNSGTLSGTIQGSTLSGTFVNNEQSLSASFSITLAADGHSFSGTFTVVGGSTGQWRSACSGGACLSNAAPPPPPPGGPPAPGGGSPAPPQLLAAAAAWGQLGPATALAPDSDLVATSPPIAPGQREADVSISGLSPQEIDLIIGTPTKKKKLTGGDCVRLALAGANALKRETAVQEAKADELFGVTPEQLDERDADVVIKFTTLMIACLDLVERAENQAGQAALGNTARAARSACRLDRVSVKVKVDRAARTVRYRSRKAARSGPATKLRMSCSRAGNGLKIRVRTRSRRIKLRKVLGKRLVIGVHRRASASGTTNVQTTFKR